MPDISRYFLCSASARARCSSYSFLLQLELETKVLYSTRAFSWLKVATAAFTFKNLLRNTKAKIIRDRDG